MDNNNSNKYYISFISSFISGIIAGVIAGFSKIGWEAVLPPRTPARDATNPPITLLEQLGLSNETIHFSYTFSETERPFMIFLVHFGFSIIFAVLYSILAESNSKITKFGGLVYGVFIFVFFHELLLPLLGTIPAPWKQPISEHISEFFGHIVWIWIIEMVRRNIHNGIMKTNEDYWNYMNHYKGTEQL
jgi:putative membrane protein